MEPAITPELTPPDLSKYQQYHTDAQSTIESCLSRYLPKTFVPIDTRRSDAVQNTSSGDTTVIVQQNPAPWWFVPYYTSGHCHYSQSRDETRSNQDNRAFWGVAAGAIALGGAYFFGRSKSQLCEAKDLRAQIIEQRKQLRSIPQQQRTEQSSSLEGLLHRCKTMLNNEIADAQISLGLRGGTVGSAIVGLAGLYFNSPKAIVASVLGIGSSAMGGLYRTGSGGYTAPNAKIAEEVSKKLHALHAMNRD